VEVLTEIRKINTLSIERGKGVFTKRIPKGGRNMITQVSGEFANSYP